MFTLIIGNKNLSSWSLRPWLVLKMLGEPFEEKHIDLTASDSKARILACNPAGKVPLLLDQQLRISDSLAICEYLADCFPAAGLWPDDIASRAMARSAVAEMHSGFQALRSELPMNIRADHAGFVPSAAAQADIDRITSLWDSLRQQNQHNGPFLFGHFTIADAFFAPVVWRFVSYHVALDGHTADYVRHMQQLPAMQEWHAAARAEAQ
ncbi:glutathione S-transferase [Aquitalea magnusonii]|jgi:glutathione S-transferase|uniref:Glutathione S-transferase n=1 Tax=Aquitalea magnusonii TaxID=332411 RepID=A0A3G9GJG2_9NEIS|nr:glutathione S-transferase family protein [Aquitalea magnusonii]BBF86819.1 glutathione S-transferase [Aquitalea magnusonii]